MKETRPYKVSLEVHMTTLFVATEPFSKSIFLAFFFHKFFFCHTALS